MYSSFWLRKYERKHETKWSFLSLMGTQIFLTDCNANQTLTQGSDELQKPPAAARQPRSCSPAEHRGLQISPRAVTHPSINNQTAAITAVPPQG